MSKIKIDELTIKQAREIAAMFSAPSFDVAVESVEGIDSHLIGKPVIIRTYSAGVHFGILDARKGPEVRLKNCRRIWYWEKAFTLSTVAMEGVGGSSKMPAAIPEIVLTECIEVIPCSEKAASVLESYPVHKQ